MNILHMLNILTNWTSPIILMIMGGLLLALGIPSTKSWRHLRYACYGLSASYFILGIACLTESLVLSAGHVIHFKVQLVLAISFFQAMLFTGTSLAFIRPQCLTRRAFYRQLGFILPLLSILFLSYAWFPSMHPYVFVLTLVAYLLQMVYYTCVFHKRYLEAKHQLSLYYRVEMEHRLRWVNRLFYLSLGVGIMSLVYVLVPFRRLFTDYFVLVYTSYYVWVVFRFVVYSRNAEFADKGVDATQAEVQVSVQQPADDMAKNAEVKLAQELDRWVKEERYLCPDSSLEEVADELHTDIYTLHDYFLSHKGILFRTWRVMLRIEKAKELLEENPTMKISDLQTRVGFSDKSYFFRRFKQVTGKTPNEYRNELQLFS